MYPALAVAAQLRKAAHLRNADAEAVSSAVESRSSLEPDVFVAHAADEVDILWVGSNGGMEEALVAREGLEYRGVSTGKMRGANPVHAAQSMTAVSQGVRQGQSLIDRFRPDVCFVTGGYVCAPVVIACGLRKVPILIYLPDMTPGMTIQWMSRLAQRVAVSFPEVAKQFGGLYPEGKAVVTGYPVREDLVVWSQNRAAARRALDRALNRPLYDPSVPLVLVWGGSQGARNINESTWSALREVLPHAHVLHIVGTRDWSLYEENRARLSSVMPGRYHPVPYLHHEMAMALAAADLSVARAGASTLGEFPVAGLPSILVPLAGVNQSANADLLASHGGALVIEDPSLPSELAPALVALIHDVARRNQMEQSLRRLARPAAALAIAREITALGSKATNQ